MNHYLTSAEEKSLLQQPYSCSELELLEKKTGSRIQIVSINGIKTLKSVDDTSKKIRMMVMSLLIKFFIAYHHTTPDRLAKFKRIIYSAKL
jgi:hypothetical protein